MRRPLVLYRANRSGRMRLTQNSETSATNTGTPKRRTDSDRSRSAFYMTY